MNSVKKLIFLAWIGYGLGVLVYAVLATEYNRMLMFKEPIQDKVLPGDVIRSEKVVDEGSCRVKCYLEPNCVSINVGPADVGGRTCELKNFTDESPPHSALMERKGYIHYAVENFCQNSPCPGNNSLCQVGFTDKSYRCVCRDGYKGDQCNDDIDECKDGSHNCGHPSNCKNVPGSFYCVCKPDFINDGTKCEASTALSSTDSAISSTSSTLLWAGSTASSTALTQPTPAADVCFSDPVGVAYTSIIRNNQMIASSVYDGYQAYYGRLQQTGGYGWCAQSCCGSQDWLQVNFWKKIQICGVATQGIRHYDWWVTDFKLSYSTDGGGWTKYKYGNGSEMTFHRSNGRTVDYHILPVPVLAKSIRFHPTNQHIRNCLRVEVYGTPPCIRGTGSLSGYCYMLFTKKETWNKARAKCKTVGAELVKIGSANENKFIKTTFLSSERTYWIGLNDQEHENQWKWTDESFLSNGDYDNWGDHNPNNSGNNQDCVQIVRGYITFRSVGNVYYDGQWNDKGCHDLKGFICKKTN